LPSLDRNLVNQCLSIVFESHRLLASLSLPGRDRKKLEAAERNLRKLEGVEYDLAVRAHQRDTSPRLEADTGDKAEGMDE